MNKKAYLLLALPFFWTACQSPPTQEVLAQEAAKENAAQETAYRFKQWSRKMEVSTIDSSSQSVQLQRLSLSLDASAKEEVKAILAQYDDKENQAPDSLFQEDAPSKKTKLPIENGAVLIGVRNYEQAYKKIKELAATYQAEILSEEEKGSDLQLENTLVLQLPPSNFQIFLEELRELSVVVREKRIWRQDLGGQFVELDSRLKNKYLAKTRLESLLRNAQDAQAILPIQRELDQITEDIELLKQAVNLMLEKSAHSSITLTFYQEVNPEEKVQQAAFGNRMAEGAQTGWTNFKESLVSMAYLWPYILLGLIFSLTALFAARSSRKRAQQAKLKAFQAQQAWLMQQKQLQQPKAPKDSE
ncbi:DUF4349 domain-containing protein [Saprospira grandis]|uniref:DUF4349 domain-containing protein n=1 Tax=Saprospira grandis TaxID=1008 RepID=UPI0022DD676E|nr:DUF4349 domain-containing protein [Saprospira grandis]WBM74534.1 DUF4349 domain-containing protein [Saprospira grandis]